MAHKTFISYKYSEARGLRDDIIEALGSDATYYTGERADSPDLTDSSTEKIKEDLKAKMYGTSVTIVVISPNLKKSKWVDWEIEYCLKEISRKGRTSKTNGLVGVIQEVDGNYDWLVTQIDKLDGCSTRQINKSKLYDIISHNRRNLKEKSYACDRCLSVDQLAGSYFSLVSQSNFLDKPTKYIENAFDKSELFEDFDLTKER